MKLLQYNIYFGHCNNININDRLSNICRKILEVDADIVCLQEVLIDKYDLIKNLVISKYMYIYPNNITTRYDTAILSKQPFNNSNTHLFEYTNMNRNLKIVSTTIDGKDIIIATSHFESEFNNKIVNKLYQYDRCNSILRDIYNRTNIPIFLCVDTNICNNSENNFMNIFSYDNKWKDVWIETGSDKNKEITFNSNTNPILLDRYMDRKENKYMSRLDRILHISDYSAINFDIINDTHIILSDHYGILCTFTDGIHYGKNEYKYNNIKQKRMTNIYTKRLFNTSKKN